MNAFLSRLPLRGKLALIAAMSVLMLLIPTALYALRALQSLQTLRHEAQGLQPAAEILQATRLAAQHRGLSNGALNGDAKAAAQRAESWAALQALRAPSTQALQVLGDTRLDQRLAAFWTDQQALAEAVAARSVPAPESFARHTKLIEQQLALLYDVTVNSQLVLHPAAAGYFLQDAALNHLPLLTELLGRLRGSGMGLLAKGTLTATDRMRLAILVERVEQASAGAQRAVTLASQGDTAVSSALSGVLADAQAAITETTTAARKQLIEPETPGLDTAAWWASTTRTIDAHFKLGDGALAMLQADLRSEVASEQRTLATAGAALLLLAGLGGWLLWAVARQTTRSIEQAIGLAQAVAAGDLTHQVAVKEGARDEGERLIQALGAMSRQLGAVVGTVRDNASQVATASAEIAQGNLDLSSRTESQASALQQTAASMEQLRTTIGHSADNARQASQLAHNASTVASRGGAAVGEVATTMQQIKQSSHRIAEIIGTIDSIAFQTNILALNAAVEAARAGEQGRGFAVVASEVRALAQRSSAAAREIRTLITASVERVEQGSQQGADAAATMAEVVQSVQRVASLIGEVSAATQEQNSGVAQVTEAVTQMDHATQQNAALVEESAAAAESLRQQAEALLQAVVVFRGAGQHAAG